MNHSTMRSESAASARSRSCRWHARWHRRNGSLVKLTNARLRRRCNQNHSNTDLLDRQIDFVSQQSPDVGAYLDKGWLVHHVFDPLILAPILLVPKLGHIHDFIDSAGP